MKQRLRQNIRNLLNLSILLKGYKLKFKLNLYLRNVASEVSSRACNEGANLKLGSLGKKFILHKKLYQ